MLDKLCNWGLKLVGFLVMNAANNIRATIFEKHTHTDTQIFCTVGESVHSRVPRKNVHSHYNDFHVPNENSIRRNEKNF